MPDKGVAIVSTARFLDGVTEADARCKDSRFNIKVDHRYVDALVLRRTMKILAHELSHLFGLKHCIYYQCVMNGWASLEEMDKSPLHLCPICLRKLHHRVVPLLPVPQKGTQIRHDLVLDRYRKLAALMQEWGLEEEAEWFQGALDRCLTKLRK